jgi:NAD(P)-dependent dehydrogenase (short-subunit alcohol dehydrogenase family)
MPASSAPSVLITGIHTAVGEAVGYEFIRNGWFVMGADELAHTSHFSRAQIRTEIGNLESYRTTIELAAQRGNGLDAVVNCDRVPIAEAEGIDFIRAAAEPFVSDMNGAIVNLLGIEAIREHRLAEIAEVTSALAALEHRVRINTVAPYLTAQPHGSRLPYSGNDADAFLEHLNAEERATREPLSIYEIAETVYFFATNAEGLTGVTFSADDSLPIRA